MSHYESPEYHVRFKEDAFELREYYDFYIVEYENPSDPDLDRGFGTLFRYISSDNVENEKISMTIPVIKEVTEWGQKMAFVVPREKWERIPTPKDPRLKVQKFEQGLFATLTYSGNSSPRKEEAQMRILEKWVHQKNYTITSNFMVAIYNGPYVPPFFRHNEVMVRVAVSG